MMIIMLADHHDYYDNHDDQGACPEEGWEEGAKEEADADWTEAPLDQVNLAIIVIISTVVITVIIVIIIIIVIVIIDSLTSSLSS